MRFPTMWYTRSLIRAFASRLNMNAKLLTEHQLEFLSLKGRCTGSSESTVVKMPHCWKSHVAAQLFSYPSMRPSHECWGTRGKGHIFKGNREQRPNFEGNRGIKTIFGNRDIRQQI